MKALYSQFQTLNTQRIFNLNPEGVDVPTEARATSRVVNPEAAAAAVAAHGADLTAAVGRLPGSGEARAIATLRAYPNLTITSGYRGPERNASAGGAVGSDHLTGNAIDFGTTDPSIEAWLNRQFPGQLWTDIHGSGGSGPANHLHVSYRPGGSRIA